MSPAGWRLRRSTERGVAEHGWLSSRHTFSFADYYDPRHMGFRALRVINEDRVAARRGFGEHGHREMEIISYVMSGQLQHADSIGNGSVIVPGDVQRMTAGTGVRHSERNPSPSEPVHFFQIWIEPGLRGLSPGYEQRSFPAADRQNRWRLLASLQGREGSLIIHQDVDFYASLLGAGQSLEFSRRVDRHLWLHVARGSVRLDDAVLTAGDAAATSEAAELTLVAQEDSELLLFDLS